MKELEVTIKTGNVWKFKNLLLNEQQNTEQAKKTIFKNHVENKTKYIKISQDNHVERNFWYMH